MAQAYPLNAQTREKLGTAESRRLRRAGQVPGNVYGHKEGPLSITVAAEDVSLLVHDGHRVVDLQLEGGSQTTMFRDVQWDAFGNNILHFDLLRIDAEEMVTVQVPIEVRGIAPGVLAGGVLDQQLNEIEMEVKTLDMPDTIRVRVTELNIGDAIHVSDLDLPESAVVSLPGDTLIVQVNEPVVEVDDEEEVEGEEEPEAAAE